MVFKHCLNAVSYCLFLILVDCYHVITTDLS